MHNYYGGSPSFSGLGEAAAAIAINAGGPADAYFSGGNTYSTTKAIDMSAITDAAMPEAVFQSERWGDFSYTIPGLAPGSAQVVTLYFAEIYYTETGKRAFDVAINGAKVLSAFDIVAVAGGGNKAVALSFAATADASGQIVIQFISGGLDAPKVNGITIAAAPSSTLLYVGIFAAVIVVGVGAWWLLSRRKRSAAPLLSGTTRRHKGRYSLR
jgi:hypothetical protein